MITPGTRGRRRAAAPARSDTTALDLLADCGREQLAVAMEASGALLRGVQALRAIQQQAAQAAAARHRGAARELRTIRGAADLFTVPADLWQGDLAAATRYWQELAAATLEMQTEIIESACAHVLDAQTTLETVAAIDALGRIPGLPVPRPAAAARGSRRAG